MVLSDSPELFVLFSQSEMTKPTFMFLVSHLGQVEERIVAQKATRVTPPCSGRLQLVAKRSWKFPTGVLLGGVAVLARGGVGTLVGL